MDETSLETKKTNPWMIVALVLLGFIVGFGANQFSIGDWLGFEKTSVTDGSEGEKQAQPKPRGLTEEQIAALPDDDTVFGDPDAKITVVEFSDFQCPYCAASAGIENDIMAGLKANYPSWQPAVPLIMQYVKEGNVRFVYRDFPLSSHPQAREAAEAGECADEQGKFLEMHDKIFTGADEWVGDDETAKKVFLRYAKDLGLDMDQFKDCLGSGKYRAEIQKDFLDGASLGVSATPAFYVNGTKLSGAQSASVFESIFESLLKE